MNISILCVEDSSFSRSLTLFALFSDKFTVLSFLEALEDSLPRMSEPEGSRQGEKDLMDEGR